LPARVTVECKLRHDEHTAFDVQERAVHFSLVILKDPKVCDSLGHARRDGRRVLAPYSEQDQKARCNFSRDAAISGYARAAYTLHNGSHCTLKNFWYWQDFSG
jgi:hypothetical protein